MLGGIPHRSPIFTMTLRSSQTAITEGKNPVWRLRFCVLASDKAISRLVAFDPIRLALRYTFPSVGKERGLFTEPLACHPVRTCGIQEEVLDWIPRFAQHVKHRTVLRHRGRKSTVLLGAFDFVCSS